MPYRWGISVKSRKKVFNMRYESHFGLSVLVTLLVGIVTP